MFGLLLKKPLALSCTAFLAVLLALVFHPFQYTAFLSYLLFGFLLAGIVALFLIKRNRARRTLFVALLFLAALFFAFSLATNLNTQRQTLQKNYHEKETFGKFLVTQVNNYDSLSEFEGIFLVIDEKDVKIGGSLITFNRSLSPIPGDIVEGNFTLEMTEGKSLLNKQHFLFG